MAKTCLLAAMCSSVRRGMRSVVAFQAGSIPGKTFTNNSVQPSSKFDFLRPNGLSTSALSMSTAADVKIMKRVKTVDAVPSEEEVVVKGWVRTVRKQKTLAFVEVNDGSSLSGIQCVLPFDQIDDESKNRKSKESFLSVFWFQKIFLPYCYFMNLYPVNKK